MSWLRRLIGNSQRTDGGAIYDSVEGGKPIPLDEEEKASIAEALESNRESIERIIDSLASEGRYLSEGTIDAMLPDATPRDAVGPLKELAYERYQEGKYRAAANTCIRALGFAAQAEGDRESEPELWHIIARIHATIGRFETATTFLDRAERRARLPLKG